MPLALSQSNPDGGSSPSFCSGRKLGDLEQALLWSLLQEDPACPSRVLLAKAAHGLADDFLTTLLLAARCPSAASAGVGLRFVRLLLRPALRTHASGARRVSQEDLGRHGGIVCGRDRVRYAGVRLLAADQQWIDFRRVAVAGSGVLAASDAATVAFRLALGGDQHCGPDWGPGGIVAQARGRGEGFGHDSSRARRHARSARLGGFRRAGFLSPGAVFLYAVKRGLPIP